MKIACVGYRKWAIQIYDKLQKIKKHKFLIITNFEDFTENKIHEFKPDYVLFYGWSWKVSDNLISQYTCLMLHPSDLPLYRGGSPIQNQIINGIKETKVTIIKMNEKIDAGDIVGKRNLNLQGSLDQVFNRIFHAGFDITKDFLENGITYVKQDEQRATYYKRRNPADSEITLEELKTKNADYLYNKIRMLADPYPNAFIRTSDKKIIILKNVEIE